MKTLVAFYSRTGTTKEVVNNKYEEKIKEFVDKIKINFNLI